MAATNFTPIQLYNSSTAAATPLAANLANGELAINIADGKLYYKDSGGVVQLLASSSGASGNVVGPASSTDNAISRFDGTTGKLIQNSVVTIADTTGNMAGVGTLGVGAITTSGALVGAVSQDAFNTVSTTLNLGGAATTVNIGAATGTLTVANATLAAKALTATAITNSALTATRLVYSGTAGLEVDSANLTFNGTDLTVSGAVNAGSINATTLDLTNLEVTNIKAKDGTASIALADTTGIATFSKATVISTTDNTNAALRITQLGTGNALLVEDSGNPDATPFVINNGGQTTVGNTSEPWFISGVVPLFGVTGTSNTTSVAAVSRYSNDANQSWLLFGKSRGAAVGTNTVVQSGDNIGTIDFAGADGTSNISAARITAAVDGTPGTNDMPGRLVFSTTADGASSPTERMRISSAGSVGIGANAVASVTINLARNITGAVTSSALQQVGEVQSDVTTLSNGYLSTLVTQATAFTLGQQRHFSATQGTIGASSAVTSQFGFYADSTLTGATNNYGFYGNIASGTNRFNFYAAGTATNFFAGNTIVSVTDNTNAALRITQLGTGNALLVEDSTNPDSTPFVIDASGKVAIGATTATENLNLVSDGRNFLQLTRASTDAFQSAVSLRKSRGTNAAPTIVASGDAIGDIQYYGYDGTQFIQAAFVQASVDGTPGTNDMPGRLVFSTTADGAATPTERMRIDSEGRVSIGGVPATGRTLAVEKTMTGGINTRGIVSLGVVQSDVTAQAYYFATVGQTVAAAFTLANLVHYYANQSTIGATSTVTNQYGFDAENTLTGATNNYGFFSNIASAANRFNFYAAGTARNYMAADLTVNGATAIPAGGTVGAGLMVSSTANFGVFFGSGAPTLSAAKGSLYLRSDGTTINDRMYVNTNGSTTWTNVVTAA